MYLYEKEYHAEVLLIRTEKRNRFEEKFKQYFKGMYYDIKRNYNKALRTKVLIYCGDGLKKTNDDFISRMCIAIQNLKFVIKLLYR
jgi:hypothetical protein